MPRNHSPSRSKKNRHSMHAPGPGPGGPPPMMMPGEPAGGYFNGPPPPHMGGPFYPPPPHHPGAPPPPPPQHYHQTPPAAPPAPNSGQPTPYSTHPPSPTSSAENLAHYPPGPPGPPPPGPQYYPQFPPGPPPPGPPMPGQFPHPGPPPHMRPGANGELGRRNTTATSRPYEREPELYPDYRQHRPVIHSHSSSSNARPDSDDSGPYMVMPGGGSQRRGGPIYRPGSGFSESSYEAPEPHSRHGGPKSYMVPSAGGGAHRRNDPV
jgi:hypothetical protein